MLTRERALYAWENRGPYQADPKEKLTPDERKAVEVQLARMDGDAAWIDAFFRFVQGKADPDLQGAP